MTSDDPVVDLAEPGDLLRIAEMHIASWRWCYSDLVPEEFLNQCDLTTWILRYRELQHNDGMTFLTAKLAGEFVGVAIFSRDPANPSRDKIDSLYVAPDKLRRGIGQRLLSEILRRLKRDVVALECAPESKAGCGFWESQGFHLNGETAAFTVPDAGVNIPTMWYVLERTAHLEDHDA